jgi:phage tail sheath protein FI
MPQLHGVKIIEVSDGVRALVTVSTAIIGLIATGPAADAVAFPLDRPVLITDIEAAISKAGTSGTLKGALRAIADQTRPVVVVVRVAPGVDDAGTDANVIGDVDENGLRTGMQALLAAETQLGVRPRILGAPGLDSQAVTTALIVVAKSLRAMVYASAIGDTVAELVTYRANFSDREVMLIAPDFKAFDTTTATTVTSFAIGRALGLRARLDQDQGWHKTISNVAVEGVTGTTRDISWDLQSDANDAGVLNAAQVTTIIRSNGFRFWGSRTCSDDAQFAFESAVRTAQILKDTIADGLMWAIDKPLRPALVKDIVETINAKFRSLQSAGYIIGARAFYNVLANSDADLAGGKVVIDFEYTPCPPLENITLNQKITDSFFADFGAGIA